MAVHVLSRDAHLMKSCNLRGRTQFSQYGENRHFHPHHPLAMENAIYPSLSRFVPQFPCTMGSTRSITSVGLITHHMYHNLHHNLRPTRFDSAPRRCKSLGLHLWIFFRSRVFISRTLSQFSRLDICLSKRTILLRGKLSKVIPIL